MDFADLRAHAERWIADDPDPATRDELRALLRHPDPSGNLADRFSGALEFGTAGLRGILGAGPNRMNRAVVARATWGLVSEVLAIVPRATERLFVVGGDARRMSREFSEDVAAIAAAAGLRVMIFPGPVPTPLVGFTVKKLCAAAGVVVTASHNPPEYSGYKVYWEDAVQILPPVDARIAEAIERAPAARAIVRPSLDSLRATGRVVDAPLELETEYVAAVRSLAVHPDQGDRRIAIVYTPLHGVGDRLVHRVLAEAGFCAVTSVPEQMDPDGAFPTVSFPNPEEPGAMDRALTLASRTGADLVLANDPDADRLAVAIPAPSDGGPWPTPIPGRAEREQVRYVRLTGNEVGALLGHYLLTERPRRGPRAVVASIVSSPLLRRMAADLDARYDETLTGFKWIAKRALELERGGIEFVFGFEEAIGYSIGDVVHDKDGISAALLVAELAAVLQSRGQTLATELEAIARRWGVFTSAQVSVTREGASGAAAIRSMMTALRAEPPRRIGDDEIVAIADYQASVRLDLRSGARSALALPSSNVLSFELSSGGRVVARPSGTEPKAKFYFDVCEGVAPEESVTQAAARARGALDRLTAAFRVMIAL